MTEQNRSDVDQTNPVDAVPELDPVIHAQARLRVMATLAVIGDGAQLAFPGYSSYWG